jgi:hypothetical protein
MNEWIWNFEDANRWKLKCLEKDLQLAPDGAQFLLWKDEPEAVAIVYRRRVFLSQLKDVWQVVWASH